MAVTIRVQYQFFLSTDAGNSNWPALWQQRIEEGIHEGELLASTSDLKKIAETHEAQTYLTFVGCRFDCWRMQNYSDLTRKLPGFEENIPGFNPHPGNY